MSDPNVATLRWVELPETVRADLAHRLGGLYGHDDDEDAFDVLAVDKQQALLLFAVRLRELDLWREIEKIGNVYGLDGVGLGVRARPGLADTLDAHQQFTSRFASHDDTANGFYEKGRTRAALHFLRMKGDEHLWTVHFDLYAPSGTAGSLLRHWWHESWRGQTPDWRAIKAALV
ncbi:MAG TPA: hypothetical protein VGO96_12905 [Pyrinomonadaceae bacterium]|jgi:hypothetical protein|nr:hypothetical protein [Pyrinomonadaceae bacterium]